MSAGLRRQAVGLAVLLLLPAAATGCRTITNYTDPAGPRYSGPAIAAPRAADTLTVVTFNIEHGRNVDLALEALSADPVAGRPDILLLQEMDATGTRRVAGRLGMGWVYYPARVGGGGRGVGNAVLSRYPIVADEKLILPHLSIFGGSQRIATAATIRVEHVTLRVYSVHLATQLNLGERERREQLEAVLQDAAGYDHAIVGGDFNSSSLLETAARYGFEWPTREGPSTVFAFRWDHILLRGLTSPEGAAGTVLETRGASDHRPVWSRVLLPRTR